MFWDKKDNKVVEAKPPVMEVDQLGNTLPGFIRIHRATNSCAPSDYEEVEVHYSQIALIHRPGSKPRAYHLYNEEANVFGRVCIKESVEEIKKLIRGAMDREMHHFHIID